DGALREETQRAGDLLRGAGMERLAVEDDLSGASRDEARERTQERGLAASVRTDDRRDPAGRDLQIEPVDDDALAVAEGEGLCGERVRSGHSEPPERFVLMRR